MLCHRLASDVVVFVVTTLRYAPVRSGTFRCVPVRAPRAATGIMK